MIIGQTRTIFIIIFIIAINYLLFYHLTVVIALSGTTTNFVRSFSFFSFCHWMNFPTITSHLSDFDVCTIYWTIPYFSIGDEFANNVPMIRYEMRSVKSCTTVVLMQTHSAWTDNAAKHFSTAFILTHAEHLNFTNLIYWSIVSQIDVRTFFRFAAFAFFQFPFVFIYSISIFFFVGDERKKEARIRTISCVALFGVRKIDLWE